MNTTHANASFAASEHKHQFLLQRARAGQSERVGPLDAIALGMLTPTELEDIVQRESLACAKIQDALGLIQLQPSKPLTIGEERRFFDAVAPLLNPGDYLGRSGSDGYVVVAPWTDNPEPLSHVLASAASFQLPNQLFRVGSFAAHNALDRVPPIETTPVPNRLPHVTVGKGR